MRIVPDMPNRTVYLPKDLDDLAISMELSLSAVLQNAIREEAQRRGTLARGVPSRYQKDQGISRGWDGGITRGKDGW
jgi:hypothetical protein